MLRLLLDATESITAINCHINGDLLTVGLLGIQELSAESIKLIDKETGDHYTVALPTELINQPIYLVGEDVPLTIISSTRHE
jgi:hypothetical protein